MEPESPEQEYIDKFREALSWTCVDDFFFNYLKKYRCSSSSKDCSVCFNQFQKDYMLIKLPCQHMFHQLGEQLVSALRNDALQDTERLLHTAGRHAVTGQSA